MESLIVFLSCQIGAMCKLKNDQKYHQTVINHLNSNVFLYKNINLPIVD